MNSGIGGFVVTCAVKENCPDEFLFRLGKVQIQKQNDDFCFDAAMPRGHFFAVLDFASHDYTNLDAALRAKLETIVGSFSSLPDFSDDLFLGFVGKEINNFVTNLAQQSNDPEVPFSAALGLVTGDRFSCFRAGDTSVQILRHEQLMPLGTSSLAELGRKNLENPLTAQVQSLKLGNADVVLIMTRGLAETFETSDPLADLTRFAKAEPKSICESLMKRSETAREDCTLVVVSGPYDGQADSAAADLQGSIAELRASLASMETRLDALNQPGQSENHSQSNDEIRLEDFERKIESLKDDLQSKAPSIDVLELGERLKELDGLLAGKANKADVLRLQRDVLKFGLTSAAAVPNESSEAPRSDSGETSETPIPLETSSNGETRGVRSFPIVPALIVLILSLAAGFGGGWLQSRLSKKNAEAWSVKTAGNQLVISRTDGTTAAAGYDDVGRNCEGGRRANVFIVRRCEAIRRHDYERCAGAESVKSVGSCPQQAAGNSYRNHHQARRLSQEVSPVAQRAPGKNYGVESERHKVGDRANRSENNGSRRVD